MRAREAEPAQRIVHRFERAVGAAVLVLAVVTAVVAFFGLGSGGPDDEELALERWKPLRAFVADFRGRVEYRAAGTTEWRALEWSDSVSEGDAIRTAADSYCDVLLGWDLGARVEPDTEVGWRRLRRDGASRSIEAAVQHGRLLHKVDGLPKHFDIDVVTPQSRSRVKGTVFEVSVVGSRTTTTVLSGVVEVVDATNSSRRVVVSPGYAETFAEGLAAELVPVQPDEQVAFQSAVQSLGKSIARLSPGRAGRDVAASEDVAAASSTATGRASAGADAEVAAVKAVISQGILLFHRNQTARALEACTPSFHAIIEIAPVHLTAPQGSEGARSKLGLDAMPFSSELTRSEASAAADRIGGLFSFNVTIDGIDADVEGEVAYGSARITVIATNKSNGITTTRKLGCIARCVKTNESWLVDLAIASEDQRPRGGKGAASGQ